MGPGAFTRRIGRNEAFNHAGNAFAAVLAGLLSSFWGPSSVFYFIAGMALLSSASVLTIPAEAIDHERARALRDGPADSHESPSRINLLMSNRSLWFSASAVSSSNSPMLQRFPSLARS